MDDGVRNHAAHRSSSMRHLAASRPALRAVEEVVRDRPDQVDRVVSDADCASVMP